MTRPVKQMNVVGPILPVVKLFMDPYIARYRENPLDIFMNILEGLSLALIAPTVFRTSSESWGSKSKTVYENSVTVVLLWTLTTAQFLFRNAWDPRTRLFTDLAQTILYAFLATKISNNAEYAWILFSIGCIRLQSTYKLVSRTLKNFV